MLVVRLKRISKKSHPTYRLVVAEKSAPVEGKFIADVGFYNPHTKKSTVIKEELMNWLNKGAKPSNTVSKILKNLKFEHASIVVVHRAKRSKKAKGKSTAKAGQANMTVEAEADNSSELESGIEARSSPVDEPVQVKENKPD